MAEDALTQTEADALLRLEKVPASAETFHFPDLGGRIQCSELKKFVLEFSRNVLI